MDLSKREKYGLIIFIVLIITVVSYFYYSNNKRNTVPVISGGTSTSEDAAKNSSDEEISVYICGEVNKPGVYNLQREDRMIKLIQLAGGFTQSADTEAVNLAEKLEDEAFIKVPGVALDENGQVISSPMASSPGLGGKININTAGLQELESLPRIGPALAQRIIDYRESNGRFKDINELNNISGIGDKIFEGLKDKITVH